MTKQSFKQPAKSVYAFIDSQNLNLGTNKDLFDKSGKKIYVGWKLDFQKFQKYLQDKFRVSKALLFIGYIAENKPLYDQLKAFGYELVFKPTTKDGSGKPKGNVDAELVLHATAVEFANYDQAVIVAGDGDYRCLHEFLVKNKKLRAIVIPNHKSESSLLKPFQIYKIFLEYERTKLGYKK
ncbi:MAG: NYN domain-containing protein [Candidatus Berkelbacteria bacterium]|nr:NYN domain-containing protein [Candidatus Berkelbacteria bacterium]MCR4308257.1 NYN domain-containing protein [Candidatus Berkelbacteria bacterium]